MKKASLLLLFLGAAFAIAEAGKFEKSISIPHGGDAKIGWTNAGCSVRSLTVRNYPSREDIEKARREKPDDNTWVWWDFHVENRGDAKCWIQIWVDIYDRAGHVVKSTDKSDTVDAHKYDDNIRLSGRMRTLDIADSPRAVIRAEIGPK